MNLLAKVYVTKSQRDSPSFIANEFMHREVLQGILHISRRFFRADFIVCDHFIDDLRRRQAFFKALPNQHRRLVDLVILFGIQIDQNAFRSVEFSEHDVFVGGWVCITHEHFFNITGRRFRIRGARELDYRCLTA